MPFAERSLEVVVDLYHKTACHKAVINEKVLQNIIKVLSPTSPRHVILFRSVHVKGVARKLELLVLVVKLLLHNLTCQRHLKNLSYLPLVYHTPVTSVSVMNKLLFVVGRNISKLLGVPLLFPVGQ